MRAKGGSPIVNAHVAVRDFEDGLGTLQQTIELTSTKLEGGLAMLEKSLDIRLHDADTFRTELIDTTMGNEAAVDAANALVDALITQSAQVDIVWEAQEKLNSYWEENAEGIAENLQTLGQDFSVEEVKTNPEGYAKLLKTMDRHDDYNFLFKQPSELADNLEGKLAQLQQSVDAQQDAWKALSEDVEGVAELKALNQQLGEIDPEVQKLLATNSEN